MTKNLNYSPGVLSMLPLFYVGWSDSVLSPSEIKLIHDKINGFTFLTEADKKYLISYTDPQNPPSREVFQSWVSSIKTQAATLDQNKKHTLAEIGIEMAKSSTSYKNEDLFKSDSAIDALKDIEASLGVEGDSSLNLLLNRLEQSQNTDDSSYSFEPKKLQAALDGDQVELKNRVRNLIRDPFFKFEHIADKEVYRKTTLAQLKELAKQGFGALPFPKEYGGYGTVRASATVFEILGFNDNSLTIKYGVQFGLFGGAVYGLGTERHHKKYVPTMVTAELLGCFAMTETGHGSNVKGLKTTATYNHADKSLIIHTPTHEDGKEYIGNALHSEMAAVFAQLIVDGESKGVHCILVPVRKNDQLLPGVKIEDNGYKLGLNGVDNGRLWFDNVKVPVENLIGEEGRGFFYLMNGLQLERICAMPAAISSMELAIDKAIQYMHEREAFGKPISKFQVLRHTIAQLASEVEALKAFSYQCCQMYADNIYDVKMCSMLKLLGSELAEKVATECLQVYGGYGFMEEYPQARMYRDVRVGTIGGGSSQIMREIIAKMIIDDKDFKAAKTDFKFNKKEAKKAAPAMATAAANGSANGHANGTATNGSANGMDGLVSMIQSQASKADALGNTLKFDFGGESLFIDGTGDANKVSASNGDADCTVQLTMEDFQALVNGNLNPMSAFMSGKLKIDGDMGVAMKLQNLFG